MRQTRVMEPETIEKNGESSKNRTSRRNILLFGVFLFVFCGFANKAAGQSWNLGNGTLTISDNSAFSSNPYPWANNVNEITKLSIGSGVTLIPDNVFENCKSLTTITIEDGQSDLNFNSTSPFSGCPIQTLNLGRNIVKSSNVFAGNTLLKTVTITGNNVIAIEDFAFSGCTSLTSINFPNSIISIGAYAFYGCMSLTSITLPNSITTINTYTFSGCGLTTLTIPENITSFSGDAFVSCSSLRTVTIVDGQSDLNFNSTSPFSGCPIQTLNLGRNIVKSSNVFAGNTLLKTVTITGNNVIAIEDFAFSGCTSLNSINFPNSITSIGAYAFSGCTSLTSITLPNSITTINTYTFSGCSLTTLTIPENITSFSGDAFVSCSSLRTVTIADGQSDLNFNSTSPFSGCPIQTLNLGRNIVKSNNVFAGNSSLSTLNITGNNVKTIEDGCFGGCTRLNQITSDAINPPTIYENTFYGVDRSISVNVPCGYLNAYKEKSYWNDFTNMNDGGCTGIANIATEKFQIFPNPAQSEIFIKSELPIKKIEICDMSGRIAETWHAASLQNGIPKISVSSLSKGIYMVRVYTDSGLVTEKVVKE